MRRLAQRRLETAFEIRFSTAVSFLIILTTFRGSSFRRSTFGFQNCCAVAKLVEYSGAMLGSKSFDISQRSLTKSTTGTASPSPISVANNFLKNTVFLHTEPQRLDARAQSSLEFAFQQLDLSHGLLRVI